MQSESMEPKRRRVTWQDVAESLADLLSKRTKRMRREHAVMKATLESQPRLAAFNRAVSCPHPRQRVMLLAGPGGGCWVWCSACGSIGESGCTSWFKPPYPYVNRRCLQPEEPFALHELRVPKVFKDEPAREETE